MAAMPTENILKVKWFGDSEPYGHAWSINAPAYTIPPSDARYHLASPIRMANFLMGSNNINARCYYGGDILINDIPKIAELRAQIANGEITSSDYVIISNAGDHGQNPDAYEDALRVCIRAAKAGTSNVLVLNTYDVSPAPTNCQFGTSFVSSSGQSRTINQAAAAAASAENVTLVDMVTPRAAMRAYCSGKTGTDTMQADGIHGFVWDKLREVGVLIDVLGLRSQVTSFADMLAVVAANRSILGNTAYPQYWSALAGGGPYYWDHWFTINALDPANAPVGPQ